MCRRYFTFVLVTGFLYFSLSPQAIAGMASPLPSRSALEKTFRLNESALVRLQTLSFFLFAVLLSALGVQLLWNYLQRDFPRIPRLSFGKALGGVVLWGLLFIIVLAMIGGARELMTPGAWQKQGFTYKLVKESRQGAEPTQEAMRRRHLERLRTSLWQFAAIHMGRFPTMEELTVIPNELWEVSESGGMRYLYVQGKSAGHVPELLVYEPELEVDQRLVLRTNGDILSQPTSEIRESLIREGKR